MTDRLLAHDGPRSTRSVRRRVIGLLAALAVLAGASLRLAGLNPAMAEAPVLIAYAADQDPGLDPGAARWSDVYSTRLVLTSQRLVYPTQALSIPFVDVKALHLAGRLFIRVEWADTTADDSTRAVEDFADAVAVEFPAVAASTVPFVCMGQADQAVNIWQWRADSQSGLSARPDAPGGYVDEYPDTSDLFYTARAAGNPYAQLGGGAIQNLVAGGFGTLSPASEQVVHGEGVYAEDHWAVVFERNYVAPGTDQPTFDAGTKVDVAFAVWNGSEGDRNGKKSVSEFTVMSLSDRRPGVDVPGLLTGLAMLALTAVVVVRGIARLGRPPDPVPRAPRSPIPPGPNR